MKEKAPGKKELAPYIHSRNSTSGIYWKTAGILLIVVLAAVFWFGARVLEILSVTVAAAVAGEAAGRRLFGAGMSLYDGHTVLMGMVLALMLPPALPLWMAGLGGFFAVFVGKELFGGLGQSPFHPALAAHVFLIASFPVAMNYFGTPGQETAGILPLFADKYNFSQDWTWGQLLTGGHPGAVGETSVLVILLAGLVFLWQRLGFWEVPLLFLGTLSALTFMTGKDLGLHLLSGGAFFAAFFILSDPSSTPHSRGAARLFAVLAAVLTVTVRHVSVYGDGVSFAILLAGICTPWLDQVARPKGARPLSTQRVSS